MARRVGRHASAFVFQVLGFFLPVPGMMDSSFLPFGGNWILLLVGEFFFLLEGIGFLQCQWRFLQCQCVAVQSGCQHDNNAHPFFCACLMCIRTIPPPVTGKNNHCNDGEQCNLCATGTKMPSACLLCISPGGNKAYNNWRSSWRRLVSSCLVCFNAFCDFLWWKENMRTNTIFSCCFKLQIKNTTWKGALDPSAKFYWFHALFDVWWWSFVCITNQSQYEKQIIVLSRKKNCCEAHLDCCETRQWIFSFSAFMKSSVFWSVCILLCKSYYIRYLSINHKSQRG